MVCLLRQQLEMQLLRIMIWLDRSCDEPVLGLRSQTASLLHLAYKANTTVENNLSI